MPTDTSTDAMRIEVRLIFIATSVEQLLFSCGLYSLELSIEVYHRQDTRIIPYNIANLTKLNLSREAGSIREKVAVTVELSQGAVDETFLLVPNVTILIER